MCASLQNLLLNDLMEVVAQRYPRLIAISDQTTIGMDWTTVGLQFYRRFGGTVIGSYSFDSETAKLEEIQSLVQEVRRLLAGCSAGHCARTPCCLGPTRCLPATSWPCC